MGLTVSCADTGGCDCLSKLGHSQLWDPALREVHALDIHHDTACCSGHRLEDVHIICMA